MLSQKEAVYQAVKSVFAEHGVSHEDFTKAELDKSMREQVISIVTTGFENNEVELKSSQDNIKSYTSGLVSNWLRKDKRLNGNTVYKPANPGSRTGQQDPMVKNLRILLSTLPEGSEAHTACQERISTRIAEVKAEKAKSQVKDIDFSCIPDDIKALLES